MNKSLLYFFGAGASAQALPLASGLAPRIAQFASELEHIHPQDASGDPEKTKLWGGSRQRLCEALRWLAEEASRHASVDTFAKKLFFSRNTGEDQTHPSPVKRPIWPIFDPPQEHRF